MAKKLLLDVLVNVLGQYVEGLSSENMHLGVWSGKIEMSNLKMKATALDKLNLPITISHGSLKYLKLKIPWAQLESKPVRVIIDGVYLQCGPLDVASLTVEELRQRVLASKRERLQAAMEAILSSPSSGSGVDEGSRADVNETAKQATYIQQLTTKILGNIEVTLTNVHVRYEDSTTVPGKTFSAGVTIESISLVTTDDKWVETFVGQVTQLDESVHKLGRMVNLGIYWSTGCEQLRPLSAEAWEREMQSRVYSESHPAPAGQLSPVAGGGSPRPKAPLSPQSPAAPSSSSSSSRSDTLQYLLAMPNNMSVMITHIKAPKENVPKLDVRVETAHLGFSLDSAQYAQIILTSTRFGSLDRQKQMALFRPARRPDKDPRAWWHYAYRLVTGTELSFSKKLDTMVLCLKTKGRYINLLKQAHGAEAEAKARLDGEIALIEDALPMASLLVFRQLAGMQIKQELDAARRARKGSSKEAGGMAGYFGGMFSWGAKKAGTGDAPAKPTKGGASAAEEDDDDALMLRIQQALRQAESQAVDQFAIRVNVASSAKLDITSALKPLMSAELSLAASAEVHAKNLRMTFSLSDVSFEDRYTPQPLSRYIVVARRDLAAVADLDGSTVGSSNLDLTPRKRVASASASASARKDGAQAAYVVFDMKEGVIALNITSLPLEITWNHQCVHQLLQFFAGAPSDEPAQGLAVVSSPLLVGSMQRFNVEAFLPAASVVDVHIEIHAPKIVVPEDSSVDRGCLLLDSGYLVIVGQISEVGMRWDISLSAVNVGMPLSVADRYKQAADGQSLYLVKPFDIRTLVQNLDTSLADLTIDIRVAPAISTELDSAKINRLVKTINAVLGSVQMDSPVAAAVYLSSGLGAAADVPLYTDVQQMLPRSRVAPDRKQLSLQVQLPAITVDLAVTASHVVVLAVTTLDMHMVQRPHDTELVFRLNSLSLQDPLRHTTQQYIIKTATSSRHTHLIQFIYRSYSSSAAPQFSGFGTEYKMDFAQMALNIDPAAVLRLKPLLEALKDLGKDEPSLLSLAHVDSSPDAKEHEGRSGRASPQLFEPPTKPSPSRGAALAPTSAAPEALASSGLPGVKLRITVDKISVDLMRSRKTSSSSTEGAGGSPRGSRSPSRLSSSSSVSLKGVSTVPEIDALTGIEILEVAYTLDMQGLSANITTQGTTEVRLFLQSFDVLDQRAVSRSYVYKSLFCRSDVASEHSSSSSSVGAREGKDSRDKASDVRGRSASVAELVPTAFAMADLDAEIEQQESIFYLLYKEETVSRTMLEVALKDVTSFIAVDAIVDIVNVAMENTNAVMELLESLNPSTIEMAAAAAARAAAAAAQTAQKIRSGSVYMGDSAAAAGAGSKASLQRRRSLSVAGSRREGKHKFRRGVPETSLGAIPEDDENAGELSPLKGSSAPAKEAGGEEGEGEVEVESKLPAAEEDDSFTFNVVVSVVNPRLIFLEDPENADSRAIVGRCGISLHYCNDIRHRSTSEVKEMVHVSLNTAEVFVLTGMLQGFPQQIIEPTGLELHLNRSVEMAVELAVSVSLDMESISGRVSFNDLALARSILSRASLAVEAVSGGKPARPRTHSYGLETSSDDETSSNPSSGAMRSRSNTVSSARPRNLSHDREEAGVLLLDAGDRGDKGDKRGDKKARGEAPAQGDDKEARRARRSSAPIQHLTMYDVSIHVGRISVVTIDDSDKKNLPVAKLIIDKVSFQATGASIQVAGTGSMVLQAEHYNTNVATWEPIVERWSPNVTFLYDAMTTSVEIASEEMVFVNVSGAMTKSISRAASLFALIGSESGSAIRTEREKFHPFVLHNELGVPLDVFDSTTTRKLVSLDSTESKPLPPSNKDHTSSQRSVHRMDVYSSNVDLRLTGPMLNQRMPLFQVPLNINRTRPYYLQPTNSGAAGGGVGGGGGKSLTGGPIVEDTYENERYDLAKGWSAPWTSLGDPPHWSDVLGQTQRDRVHVMLPSERWEWADERWTVDVSGVVGKEIDEGGWEYATSFNAFTMSKQRRSKQPLDSVRRRRWVRTRVLKAVPGAEEDDSTRPMTLFWDVRARPNGSRVVRVRSGLQVKNCMPFAIELVISMTAQPATPLPADSHKGWKNHGHGASPGTVLGPIAEGQVLSIPLLLTHTHTLRIRPHAALFPNPNPMDAPSTYDWSDTIDCRLKALDKQAFVVARKALQCAARRRAQEDDGTFAYASQPLHMRAEYRQDSDNSRLIIINPLAVLINQLPCEVAYRCKSANTQLERVSSTATRVTKTGEAVEQGVLKAGTGTCKLVHVDLVRGHISLKLGNFAWSVPTMILPEAQQPGAAGASGGAPVAAITQLSSLVGKESTMVVDLSHPGEPDQVGQLSVSVCVTPEHMLAVTLFSRHALVDMSGLQMSVRCLRVSNVNHAETREVGAPETTEAHLNALLDEHGISKDISARQLVLRRTYSTTPGGIPAGNSELSWAHGANGLCLFQSAGNKVSFGIKRGRCWVDNISIVLLSSGKVPFEIVDPDTKRVYLLSYTVSPMEGVFRGSQQVTVMPSYVVVNCMEEPLEIKQAGTGSTGQSLVIAAGGSAGWHITDRDIGREEPGTSGGNSSSSGSVAGKFTSTSVHLRTESSTWSLGSIDLNDIGTSIIILPCRDGYTTESVGAAEPALGGYSYSGGNSHRMLLAHVEVKLAEPQDNAYITIVIWRQTMGGQAPLPQAEADAVPEAAPKVVNITADAELSVRNDTDFPITLQQAGIDFEASGIPAYGAKFEICVPPRCWLPYGWADPSAGSMAIACVGTSLGGQAIIEMIDMLRVGEATTLDLSHLDIPREEMVIRVAALGSGKVLHVTRQHKMTKEQLAVQREEALSAQPRTLVLKASISQLSLSLIAERPVRREFLSVCLAGTEGRITYTGQNYYFRSSTAYELKVMDLVVDNYCECAVYPVLLNSRDTGDKRKINETRLRLEARERERELRERQREGKGAHSRQDTWSDTASARSGGSSARSRSSSGSSHGGSSVDHDEEDAEDEESSLDTHFLIFQAVTEVPLYASTAIFRRIAMRMLELEIMLDSSTLQLYLCDLHGDLTGDGLGSAEGGGGDVASSDLESAVTVADRLQAQAAWVADFNRRTLRAAAAASTSSLVAALPAKETAQRHKVYFEQFVMHPIKLRLSFVPTPFPSNRDQKEDILTGKAYRKIRLFKGFSYINELVIKMNSFIFSNAMESLGSLGARVAGKVTEDLRKHLVQIAGRLVGSLGIIGKPAGVYKNIGSGVTDFFYEPYQGLMHSPKGFAIGAARGTKKLFAGFASSLVGSTASIVGSASKGVAKGSSLFAGDKEYAAKRDEKRRLLHAGGGGVKAGAKAAGESVFQGFASGLSGLISKPFEEGRKTGALGFVKGMGMGLAGALAKPVVGITDGIGAFSQGVTNRMNSVEPVEAMRPPRAFERSAADYSALILVPWDPQAAAAQTLVRGRAASENASDDFAAFVALSLSGQSARATWQDSHAHAVEEGPRSTADRSLGATGSIILSNELIFRLNSDGPGLGSVAWIYPWGNVSHCLFKRDATAGTYAVELVVYSKKSLHVKDSLAAAAEKAMTGRDAEEAKRVRDSLAAGGSNTELLPCGNRDIAVRLYTHLAQSAARMGNPSSVLPVDIATKPPADAAALALEASSSASSSSSGDRGAKGGWRGKPKEQLVNPNQGGAVVVGEDGGVGVREWHYQFGSANRIPFSKGSWPEREVLRRASMRLLLPLNRVPLAPRPSTSASNHDDDDDDAPLEAEAEAEAEAGERAPTADDVHQELDRRVWQLVCEWNCTHGVLNTSRCLALILINHSPNPVQVLRTEVKEGKNVVIFGVGLGNGYDAEARTLLGHGGAAVVFAHGFRPSPIDLAHVKIVVQTSACECQVSTRPNRTECAAVGGFNCGYLEKSLSDVWAKYVLLIQ